MGSLSCTLRYRTDSIHLAKRFKVKFKQKQKSLYCASTKLSVVRNTVQDNHNNHTNVQRQSHNRATHKHFFTQIQRTLASFNDFPHKQKKAKLKKAWMFNDCLCLRREIRSLGKNVLKLSISLVTFASRPIGTGILW